MEKFFQDLDRLFYLCSPYSSNNYDLKGYVFLDNVPSIYAYWFGSKEKLPDYKIPLYVWKKYGFKTFKVFWEYNKQVKKLRKYYEEMDLSNIKVIEDNSEIWRYYTIYKPLKIDKSKKTLSEEGSITYNNILYVKES